MILGLSAFYHDSAACLVADGAIVAAAQEERFTRKKHDPGFPQHAIAYCLREAGVTPADIDYVVFYEKPFRKFERLIETYLAGNRAASKSVLRRLDDASRLFGATYELFYRAHRNGKPAIRKQGQLAQVILGMLHYRNLQSRVRLFHYDEPVPALWQIASSLLRARA